MVIQGAVSVFSGMILCFMGYSLFRGMLPLWGGIIGGLAGISLLPLLNAEAANQLMYQGAAFLVGAIIGAAIATPFYFIVIFLLGAALGAMAGRSFAILIEGAGEFGVAQVEQLMTALNMQSAPKTSLQTVFMLVGAVAAGTASIGFQHLMIIVSSSVVGAAAIITGLSQVLQGDMVLSNNILLLGWALLAAAGLVIQARSTDDPI